MLLRHAFLVACVLVPGTCPVLQAQGPADWAAYTDASSRWDMKELRDMEARFSSSASTAERAFGLLVSAKIDYRDQQLASCMKKLDSLLHYPQVIAPELEARAHRMKCIVNTDLRFLPEAVKEADLGLAATDSVKAPELYAELLVAKAEALAEIPDFKQAHPLLSTAFRLAETAGNERWMGAALVAMGNIQYRQENYLKAVESYRHAVEVVGDPSDHVTVHAISNLASASVMAGEYALAEHLLDSLLEVLGPRDPRVRLNCMATKGFIHARQKNFQKAIDQYNMALAVADSAGLEEEQAKILQHLSYTLWKTKEREQGMKMADRALELAERSKNVLLQSELHRRTGIWHHELGNNDQAYLHAIAHRALSDSLATARFNQQLAHAEILFDTERKEHQIAEQKQALELAAAVERRQNLQRLVLVLVVLAIGIIALLLWRSLRRRHVLAEQQRLLHVQEVNDLMRRNEINTMQAMLDGQEKERERTARDLHDRLGAMLSTVKMQMGVMEDKLGFLHGDQRSHYNKVLLLMDEAIDEVRRIAHGSNSAALSRFGLAKALEDLCDKVRVSGKLDVELTLFGLDERMGHTHEVVIYRIVQELISNVLKHAGAHEISVGVTREAGRFSVMVTDDGKGFDPGKAKRGIGLDNIRSRAASIGATIKIDSTPGHGTTVSVEGPVLE